MSQDVVVPSPGESVSGGILAKWLAADGAAVNEGQELFELETDKATMAVPATTAGVLRHRAAEGQDVTVGDVVAVIEPGQAAPAPQAPAPRKPEASPAPPPAPQSTPAQPATAQPASPPQPPPPPKTAAPTPPTTVPSAPAPAPAVAAPAAAATPVPAPPGAHTRERMSTLRKRIAANLVQAQRQAALLTTFNEIDLERFMTIRKTHGEAFEKRHGVKLGFMSMFVKACCRGLADFRGANAMVDGDDIVYHQVYNIGVAVSTERGLIVPVVRDADRKTFAAIELEIKALAERARAKTLSVDDLTGGTFTITNGGIFGSLLSTPIPTPPQTAILGMHTIQKRPVVVKDAIVIRPMMYVALTYDHRVIDGREAVGFLARVKQIIEDPDSLLFDL